MNNALVWFAFGLGFVILGCKVLGLDIQDVLGGMIIFIAVFAVLADFLEW